MAKKKAQQDETQTQKKSKSASNDDIVGDICTQVEGAEILHADNIAQMGFASTGNLALNFCCSGRFINGGLPLGKVTEVFGPSSTGKTVIGTHALQGIQRAGGIGVLIDSESAYSSHFGEALGIDTSRLIYMQPECLEDCFQKIIEVVNLVRSRTDDMRPVMIVYDSIAASPCRQELEKIKKGEDIGALMGRRALISSDYLRNVAGFLNKQRAGVIVINQVREKIGLMFGNPETTAGGGRSLEFYCSVRLNCRNRGKITDKSKRAIGINLDVLNAKNKIAKPFRDASGLELFFDQGISPTSGLAPILVEENRLLSSGGWFQINPEFLGRAKDAKKFQKKDLVDVLFEYPELVDAESGEAVQEFLGVNRQSLEASMEDFEVDEESVDNE